MKGDLHYIEAINDKRSKEAMHERGTKLARCITTRGRVPVVESFNNYPLITLAKKQTNLLISVP